MAIPIVGSSQPPPPHRHCEERSDAAIRPHTVIARSAATWQSVSPAPEGHTYIAHCPLDGSLINCDFALRIHLALCSNGEKYDIIGRILF